MSVSCSHPSPSQPSCEFAILLRTPDKSRIVEEGNYHKFTKGKHSPWMAKKLLETGDRELVEVSDP